MSMKVKFLDLQRLNAAYAEDFSSAASNSVRSGVYVGGDTVRQFELAFSDFCGSKHCVAVGNGLDALTLALRALGVGPGDEVIVPGHTFIATWLSVSQVGAKLVPVDVSVDTGNIDPSLIKSAINSRTRAIIPVHLYGTSVDMSEILDLSRKSNIFVVEDAAQAHGDTRCGKAAGTYGQIGCFSFYPSKNLGALGDAGGIVTDDERLAMKVRQLSNYGSSEKYIHVERGINSRMDPVQAAFLSIKLADMQNIIDKRQRIAAVYTSALASKDPNHIRRLLRSDYGGVWHNFVVLVDDRISFMEHMQQCGVETAVHYPRIPSQQQCYINEFGDCSLPVSQYLSDRVVSLPIGEYLDVEEVKFVCDALISYNM